LLFPKSKILLSFFTKISAKIYLKNTLSNHECNTPVRALLGSMHLFKDDIKHA